MRCMGGALTLNFEVPGKFRVQYELPNSCMSSHSVVTWLIDLSRRIDGAN